MPSCRSPSMRRRMTHLFVGLEAGIGRRRILFVGLEAGIETGGWKPEIRVSRTSIDTSIDNLKRKMSFEFPGQASIRASTTLNENCTLGTLNFRHLCIATGGSLKRSTRFCGHKLGDGLPPTGLFMGFWGKERCIKNFLKKIIFLLTSSTNVVKFFYVCRRSKYYETD